jgi:hypothetical protein
LQRRPYQRSEQVVKERIERREEEVGQHRPYDRIEYGIASRKTALDRLVRLVVVHGSSERRAIDLAAELIARRHLRPVHRVDHLLLLLLAL